MINAINEIKKSKKIAIFSHINPDGDTYGSGLSLYLFLKKDGKDVFLFCDGKAGFRFENLNNIDLYNSKSDSYYDLAIAVDCSDIARLGKYVTEFDKAKKSIVFDHHAVYEKFTDITVRDTKASSNCEIVLNFMENYNKTLIDKEIAELLYMGMVTDNGIFSYDSVTGETFICASRLFEYGIDNYKISYEYFVKTTQEIFNLKNRVLSRTRFYEDDKIGLIYFTKKDFEECKTQPENTSGIINNVLNIDKILIAISVVQIENNSYRVSIRTKAPHDASKIAVSFGGGGHIRAAGCRISGFMEDVIDKLVRASSLELL